MARLGISSRSSSTCKSCVRTPSGVRSTNRPATDSGRSVQLAHRALPYISVLSVTYGSRPVIASPTFTLNVGASLWLATI